MMQFTDRHDAGRQLAKKLVEYQLKDVIVYALPRGGVVLGVEVAKELDAPLDLLLPRKIGHPDHPEYAICAITETGVRVCSDDMRGVDEAWLEAAIREQAAEARRRRELYLEGHKQLEPTGKTAVIVDDGIATGLTMLAAIMQLEAYEPAKVIVAVPVTPLETADMLRESADDVIALDEPVNYIGSVGAYYDYFEQVDDDEVIELMEPYLEEREDYV